MTQISLVLPFALPPPQLAPDLVRALKAPALASLLTRTSSYKFVQSDDDARALPHETWLAAALGTGSGDRLPLAAHAMRGYGLEPGDGTWFIVHPAHIEIARSHMLMSDMRGLALDEGHSRALFEAAKPYFEDAGKPLLYGDASTWFMRADAWAAFDTATPDAAAGMNLNDWLPRADNAIEYRKLQNEVQMLWYQHPANAEREATGLAPINAFWPWAAARSSDVVQAGAPPLATSDAPGWLSSLAQRRGATLGQLLDAPAPHSIHVSDGLTRAAIASDWAGWLAHMQQLEDTLFAPALAAMRAGRIGQLRLVLSHRGGRAEFTTTRMAQHAFWRQPSLNRLLP